MKNIMSTLKHWWLMRSEGQKVSVMFPLVLLLPVSYCYYMGSSAYEYRKQEVLALSSYSTDSAPYSIRSERECWGEGRIHDPFPDNTLLPICMLLKDVDFITTRRAGQDNARTAMWQQAPWSK